MTSGIQRTPRGWIFQANPDKYRIFDSLATQQTEMWNLRQHSRDVGVGDRVYIWVAGGDAGIYAVGTVLSSPQITSDSPTGIIHWFDPRDGRRPITRVEVRYERVMLDRPLLKHYLYADPVLRDLTILKSPRRTNFALSGEEAAALEEWFADEA